MKLTLAVIALLQATVALGELRIVDPEGRPVAGARVESAVGAVGESTTSPLPASRASAVTGEDGVAAIRLAAADRIFVVADHTDYEPARIEAAAGGAPREIRLQPGFVWEASVAIPDADEEEADVPVRGNVCASGRLALGSPTEEYVWQRCAGLDGDGRFRLPGLPAGAMRVEAQVPGFLPFIVTLDPREETRLVLERGARLNALVQDVRGRPVPGAVCRAGERAKAGADRAGRCTVGVKSLPARLDVRAPGFRQWEREVASEAEVEVRLVPSEQVFGTLLAWDGAPVNEASVSIEQTFEDGRTRSTRRSLDLDDGAFTIDLPGPGTYALRVEAPGHRELRLGPLTVGEQQVVPLGVSGLKRGAGFRGRVVDETTGAPLEGVLVEVVPVGPFLLRAVQRRPPSGVSDENGEFRVSGLLHGRYLVRMQRTGMARVHRLVDLASDEIVSLDPVSPGAGVELRLRLVDRDSEARSGLQVRLSDAARETLEPIAVATSDDTGIARFSALAPGRYRAEVRSERLLLAQEIEVGRDATDQELRVSGVRLRGRVTRDGVPVGGGFVRLTSALDPSDRRGKIQVRFRGGELSYGLPESSIRAEVGPDGAFLVEDAPAGVVIAGYVGMSGEVVVRSLAIPDKVDAVVSFELAGLPLEGRVVEEGTGVGIAAAVGVSYADGRRIASLQTDPQGWFRVADLEPGAYDVTARAAGYAPARLRGVSVTEETSHQVLQLRPGEAGSVEVALARADGTPVDGAPVTVYDAEGTLVKSLPTTASGERSFAEIPEGEYFVAWMEPLAGAGSSAPVSAGAFQRPKIEPVLETGASVILVCPAANCGGAPVELLEVRTTDGLDLTPLLSGLTPALRFGADGELSLGRLARGRYLFRLWVAGERWEKETTVGEGEVRIRVR